MPGTYKYVKNIDRWTAFARLYMVSPPFKYRKLESYKSFETNYIIVSTTVTMLGSETIVVAANQHGEVIGGSIVCEDFRGEISHDEALRYIGYEKKSWQRLLSIHHPASD